MADVIRKATNRFTKGLIMDFSPENTRNEVLTNALNATLLTFNGNELSLQNDMGNARVETAYLPEGYMPVGTCEYGGIIYVVSYNPLENKSQIGCFPSPERNVSSDELGKESVKIQSDFFQKITAGGPTGEITNMSYCAILRDDKLNPGDKFIITANNGIYEEALENLKIGNEIKKDPILTLNIVSIEDSGKITYLNSDVLRYDKIHGGTTYNYHILGSDGDQEQLKKDIDAYRSAVSSGYSVFKSKTSGKLAILAELVSIDSYSVTHSVQPRYDKDNKVTAYDVFLHHDVTPNDSDSPKLRYYCLSKSQGFLNTKDGIIEMFQSDQISSDFNTVILENIFVKTESNDTVDLTGELGKEANFDFQFPNTYHKVVFDEDGGYDDVQLASITLPKTVTDNGVDLPFIYDYTLTPCMSYGKLDHLAVSNTVDFSKLHDFNKSEFTTWKYLVEQDQVRLTFGADVYDTYESDKVDGILLEFYDNFGFVGSLLIDNKKSYSGVYTKLLQLNSSNFLGKTQAPQDPTDPEPISEQESDNRETGKLQSNLIYGVKTYLRRTVSGEEEYIPKSNFSLLTMPLLNEYYYSVDNFNNITKIDLDFLLTYKLEDSCDITHYQGEGYTEGYDEKDYNTLQEYRKGTLSVSDTEVTKVYQYSGTSKLKLEIGLREEYSQMGFSYDPVINKNFECTLKLSDDIGSGKTMQAYVNGNPISSTLELNTNVNPTIKFEESTETFLDESSKYDVSDAGSECSVPKLTSYMFINGSSENHITIGYDLVVGYKISVTDISPTEIPVTTICALCHQDNFGSYNYSDFGIREENGVYYSDSVFYNSGTYTVESFGLGQQNKTTGHVYEQCTFDPGYEQTAQETKAIGKLNSGDPLKSVIQSIPKLSFCLPHVHGIDEKSHVNIVDIIQDNPGPANEEASTPIFSSTGNDNLTVGTRAFARVHLDYPRYSSSLLTTSVVDYQSIFVPTIDYKIIFRDDGYRRVSFTGLDGESLTKFNKSLLTTMKNVYAYNPDYSNTVVCQGLAQVQEMQASFTSNLISTNAKLTFAKSEKFTDYITIRGTKLTRYLKDLSYHVKLNTEFGYSLEYCGGNARGYLVTPITYQLPKPNNIFQDFESDFNNIIIIKDHEGNSRFEQLSGQINKHALYGFDSNNSNLVQLNASNYKINSEGELSLLGDVGYRDEIFSNYTLLKNVDNLLTYTHKSSETNLFNVGKLKLTLTIENWNDADYFMNTYDDCIIIGRKSSLTKYTPLKLTCKATLENKQNNPMDLVGIQYSITGRNLGNGYVNLTKWTDIRTMSKNDLIKLSEYGPDKTLSNNDKVSKYQQEPYINNALYINGTPVTPGTRYNWSNLLGTTSIELMSSGNRQYDDTYPALIKIELKHFTFRYNNPKNNTKSSIINNTEIVEYKCFEDDYYKVNMRYSDAQLKGTSICLDDLEYDPYSDHRLYIKQNIKSPNTSLGLFVNYREIDEQDYIQKDHMDLLDFNKLRFYLGPCFTKDNL